jgi:preprotein translocase subunit SecY
VTAGVIPIIFAVAFLSVPSFAGQLLTNSHNVGLQHIGTDLTAWFQPPTVQTFSTHGLEAYIYPVVYFLLVFLFTFFYTSVAFNSNEIAENLQKQGGFIEGVRSGSHTEKYLSKVINRLTLFGAISLGMLALVPVIAQIFIGTSIAIGGTSILILVSVSLQTLRAIESRALMVTYDQYSESDFFTDMEPEAVESTKKRRFSLIPFRRSK